MRHGPARRRTIEQRLARIKGGSVLDVGTGPGRFAQVLAGALGGWDEIVGIDTSQEMIDEARATVTQPGIRFALLDAGCLPCGAGRFDTVAMAHGLHHLWRPARVLDELRRVLKPSGTLIVLEPYRDCAQLSQRLWARLHALWAEVDARAGLPHRRTYRRRDVLRLIRRAGFVTECLLDVEPVHEAPANPQAHHELREASMGELRRVRVKQRPAYRRRVEALLERIRRAGALSPTELLVFARRPRN